MNTLTARLLLAILITFMTLTVVNVVINILKNDYVTETAVAVSTSNSVVFKGIYVRDEEVMTYDGNGVISYAVDDGGRLRTGETAAYVYNNDRQIRIKERLAQIESEIAILKKIQNPGTQEVAQPAYLASLIEGAYKNILFDKESGNLERMKSEKEELLIYLSTMQYVTQEVYDFADNIAVLEAEKHELELDLEDPLDTITVPYSSYFVSYSDGYEEVLDFEKAQTLTASEIKSITDFNEEKAQKKSIGKLVRGYDWRIIGIIEDANEFFKEGNSIKLFFPSSGNSLDAVIESIRSGDTETEKIITILCTDMSYDFVQHRVETIEIQDDEYKGIRIPRDAIYIKEMEQLVKHPITEEEELAMVSVPGAYIKHGEKIVFKKIDPVFQGDDFVVSRVRPDEDYVQLYDDTIVGGLTPE